MADINNDRDDSTNEGRSRRDFIRRSITGVAGFALCGYTVNDFYIQDNLNEFSRSFRNDAPDDLWKWSREADYSEALSDGSVDCTLCPHRCRIGVNDRGFCRTRVNLNGRLYTVVYGNACAAHVDPVEKKPLFHFLPGSAIFSIAAAGCNLRCLNCQNWSISQFKPEDTRNYDLMPDRVVELSIQSRSLSIAYTYSEPVVFYEYAADTARAAKERGLRNVWVSAGYINEKPLREACDFMDAANIDLKGFDNNFYRKVCQASYEPVLNTLVTLKDKGVWIEVTRLIVPVLSDDLKEISLMCRWIYDNLGPDAPLHFSRFHPAYKVKYLPPTPVELLKEARRRAMDIGLRYVYVGNVPGYMEGQTTFCPNCKMPVIVRAGYTIVKNNLKGSGCGECGESIAGVWEG